MYILLLLSSVFYKCQLSPLAQSAALDSHFLIDILPTYISTAEGEVSEINYNCNFVNFFSLLVFASSILKLCYWAHRHLGLLRLFDKLIVLSL